ncbi:hypothetical protein WJX82_009516 [Trebouxia sp. C0006]
MHDCRALLGTVQTYFLRWKGDGERHPPPPPIYRTVLAWLGSFLSLLLIGGMHQWINTQWSLPLLLSTFGPACALVFGLPTLPASQPMNCMGGNLVGGIVGLFWRVLVGRQAWLAMALSCSTAIAAMEMTSLQYPPGITTSLLLSTVVPESTFQLLICAIDDPVNDLLLATGSAQPGQAKRGKSSCFGQAPM